MIAVQLIEENGATARHSIDYFWICKHICQASETNVNSKQLGNNIVALLYTLLNYTHAQMEFYTPSLWNPPSCWQAVAASSGPNRRLQTVPQALLMQTSTLPSLVNLSWLSLPTSLRSPVVQFPGNVVEGSRNVRVQF